MPDAPFDPARVENHTVKPPGVLPKHLQTLILGGVALCVVLVIGFSGDTTIKRAEQPSRVPLPIDPNEARIQDYRARIEEQRRKLATEQAHLAREKEAMNQPPLVPSAAIPAESHAPSPIRQSHFSERLPDRALSLIEREKEKREYHSHFASNVALSYRDPVVKTLAPTPPAVANASTEKSADPDGTAEAGPLKQGTGEGATHRLFEGTVIETTLANRLDGAFSGPVNCMVTTNVYSPNRLYVLIPQGSRLLGEALKVDSFGQQRLAIVFHRLLLPDGRTVSLDASPGLNQIGETGLRDQVNHHYAQVFGVSLAIGAIAGWSQANTSYGFDRTSSDAYQQGVAASLSQSSLRILDRYLNVLPTFTIREGHRVKVILSKDIWLPAYERAA